MGKVDLDETDLTILKYLIEDPKISQHTIAKKINKSQPAVGARIKKYEELGLLQYQCGINFRKANLFVVIVNLKANNASEIWDMAKSCPFIINAFRISGKYNICVLLASTKLEKLYNIVNFHFRMNPGINKISMEIISDFAKDFVLPIDFNVETLKPSMQDGCGDCNFCQDEKIMRFEQPQAD
ncbi:MAG: putative HTH-type transcriptional regulator [Candidatus Lokiarchaeum sp. GC14_75]|nr:MAG: putative HTH-type transcriptional regulator [Candidatus Lokiarchaeum sp. GC14_75]